MSVQIVHCIFYILLSMIAPKHSKYLVFRTGACDLGHTKQVPGLFFTFTHALCNVAIFFYCLMYF